MLLQFRFQKCPYWRIGLKVAEMLYGKICILLAFWVLRAFYIHRPKVFLGAHCCARPGAICTYHLDVQNKQHVGGTSRPWPLAALDSAQSAAGAPRLIRGEEHSRPSPSLLRCAEADVEQERSAALRHISHVVEGLMAFSLLHSLSARHLVSVNLRAQCACMI